MGNKNVKANNENNIKIDADIVWADSDKNIENSAGLLKNLGLRIHFFNDTPSCLNFFENNKEINVKCIITSLFGSERRKKLGHPNCFQMIEIIKKNWQKSYFPFLVMMTASADEQLCKDFGFNLVIYNDREKMQRIVIDKLKNDTEFFFCNKLYQSPSFIYPCKNLLGLAKEYLSQLNLNIRNFDHFVDRCFCKNCEPKLIWYRGNPRVKYALPIGWYRFGIKIRDEYINNKIEMSNWHVGYHGTNANVAKSIVEHKRIMFPGDTLNDGTILQVKHNQCYGNEFKSSVIYISPSIIYAKEYSYGTTFKGKNVKIAFQCRIKPGTYKKRPETLGYGDRIIDENFSNKEIEWVTDDRKAVVPFGLLIGFF